MYVVDYGNNRVQKFDNAGNYITQWGSLGSAPGQFNEPHQAAVDAAGNVYVTDLYNSRVQKFTGAGVYVSEFGSTPGPGFLSRPIGVVVAPDGSVFATDIDPSTGRIVRFTSAGAYVVSFAAHSVSGVDGTTWEPSGLAIDIVRVRLTRMIASCAAKRRVSRRARSTPHPSTPASANTLARSSKIQRPWGCQRILDLSG